MSFLFTYIEVVPSKEELIMLSKKGKENVQNGKTLEYFRRYNQFKKDAISNLQYARETVFATGETKVYLNEYKSSKKEECDMFKDFVQRFNKEKITNVELFFKPSECESYFDWS
jgi:hypothetical protein